MEVTMYALYLVAILNFVWSDQLDTFRYTREFLLGLQWSHDADIGINSLPVNLPPELLVGQNNNSTKQGQIRKRGKRGGVKQRTRKLLSKNRIPLPSIILANARSLRNKTDELQANVVHLRDYRDACLMAFTETWLNVLDTDSALEISGFGAPLRLDRDSEVTHKTMGGGVCLYINRRWCRNITVRERLCLPDIELLSVSLRPDYLPREFPQIFVTVVYIHPKADAKAAADIVFKTVNKLQSISPVAPNFILGDFNHCNLKKTLNSFYQYVTCPTRRDKTLDLCYGSIKGAYTSKAGPALGASDHNTVHLLPAYTSVLRREKPVKKQVQVWNEDSSLALQGCFECTDWTVFQDSCSDINELTDVVCSYISFCKDFVLPTREVKLYPNNKQWISKDIKELLIKRKTVFNKGDVNAERAVRKEIRTEIKKAKLRYKDKIEAELRSNNLKRTWKGMKTMIGSKDRVSRVVLEGFSSDKDLADGLNVFYTRFNSLDFYDETKSIRATTQAPPSITVDRDTVAKMFRHTKSKSPGPDDICGKTLRTCADQLCDIFQNIFNLSLIQQKVPKIWKHSTIVPIAKCNRPKTLNDFRPVALTSLVMKVLEKIIKEAVLHRVGDQLDPLQFAYRAGRGVEDAVITLLHFILSHLDGAKTHARLLFVDFTSAFNTIQPYLLAQRLLNDFNLDFNLVGWLLDFLINRSQCVRANSTLSDVTFTSTGSPQGCCLSPLLYILYTNQCRSLHQDRYILKFADDSVIVSLLSGDEQDHGPVLSDFVKWCDDSSLHLNVSKTKDMVIDFRKAPPPPTTTIIKGTNIELVENYKYLGVIIDKKLCFEPWTDHLTKKVQQRMYFLRKMNTFNVSSEMMTLFYRAFIESVLMFCIIAWFGSLSQVNKNRLGSLVNLASKTSGRRQSQPVDLYKRQLQRKASAIAHSQDHPLRAQFELLPSRRRYRALGCRTKRMRMSFIPSAVKHLNDTCTFDS